MDHPARVGIATAWQTREGVEQAAPLQRARPAAARRRWYPDGVRQGPAADEPHRVEGLAVPGPVDQLVDRHDAGVFELAGDLGFAGSGRPLRAPPRAEFLEGHFAAQVAVVREPDAADAARGVQSGGRVTVAAAGLPQGRGRKEDGHPRVRADRPDGGADVRVRIGGEAAATSSGSTAASDALASPPCLLQLLLEQSVDQMDIVLGEPAALGEHVGERRLFAPAPGRTALGELLGGYQVGLEGQHAEQEVVVGGVWGHGTASCVCVVGPTRRDIVARLPRSNSEFPAVLASGGR